MDVDSRRTMDVDRWCRHPRIAVPNMAADKKLGVLLKWNGKRRAWPDAHWHYISGWSVFNYNGRICLRSQINKSARTALEEPKFGQPRICQWSEYLRIILQSNLQSFERTFARTRLSESLSLISANTDMQPRSPRSGKQQTKW